MTSVRTITIELMGMYVFHHREVRLAHKFFLHIWVSLLAALSGIPVSYVRRVMCHVDVMCQCSTAVGRHDSFHYS